MANYTGFTADTAEKLVLDAGAFFTNFVVGTDTYESARTAGKLLGATTGGGTFAAVPEIRKIEIDGLKTSAKGLKVIDGWAVTLTANVKEVSADVIKKALINGAVDATDTTTGYDKIEAKNEIALTDYISNVTWVGRLSGSNKPVIIQVYNALCNNGLTMATADKGEAVIAMTFEGHATADDLDTPPFAIYYPTTTGE